jgi:hypothetical protein
VNEHLPLTLRIQWAIAKSDVPREIRHLILTMAMTATSTTGKGLSSQATIGKLMGCDARTVRRYEAELESLPDSPVAIERTRRGGKGGKGRLPDEWTLVLKRTTVSVSDGIPSGQLCPIETSRSGQGDPVGLVAEADKRKSRSGQKPTAEADTGVLLSTYDLRSKDLRSNSAPRKPRKRVTDSPPVPGVHELKIHYVEQLELHRKVKAEFGDAWSRAMKAFGKLVTRHGLEPAKLLVTNAMKADPQYNRRINPWELVDDALKWIGPQPKANAKKPDVQRGGYDPGWGKNNPLADGGGE